MNQKQAGVMSRRALLRTALYGAGALTAASLLAACGPSAPPQTAATAAPAVAAGGGGGLKIGLLSGFSGPYAAFGPDMASAIDVYLDEHNGMIGGLKPTVIQEDETANPQDALLKARKLVEQDRVNLLIGLVSSANALAVRDLLDSSRTPTIITNAGADDITGAKRSPYIVRVSFSSWQQGAPSGKFAVAQGWKKVMAFAPDYAAGYEQLAGFADTFTQAGGTVVEKVYPPLGNSDYAPFLGKIQSAKPDAVWAFFAGADQIKFVQQYEQFIGSGIPLFGNTLSRNAADAVGKTITVVKMGCTGWEETLDNPLNGVFVADFMKKFNRHNDYGQYTYDGVMLLDKVLTALKGDTSPDKLAQALNGVSSFQSIRGEVQIDPDSHGLIQSYYQTVPVADGDKYKVKVVGTLGVFGPSKQIS
ncbi:MAG TPA: ABC transporter substrate-binding protein [Chloroflexota bacterium]|nr:ABC transporter substrate-binding protein [Chloroflexota bacterium]